MASRARERLPIYVDVRALQAKLEAVELLGHFQLIARRRGYTIVLRHASRELVELIELAGLCDALPVEPLRPGSTAPS